MGSQPGTPPRCYDKFPKLWNQNHFLARSGTYVYLPNNLSQEETYLKKKLAPFWGDLGFANGVRLSTVASKKWYIETWLLMEATTKISGTIFLVREWKTCFYFICHFKLGVFIVFICHFSLKESWITTSWCSR